MRNGRAADGVDARRSSSHPEVDIVRGDERRLRQIVFNLLSNAVKFTPAGGSVVVATRSGSTARCTCRSPTPGRASPPEERERIFEEFQQTDVGVGAATRAPGSGSRWRSGSSSCTAAGSGSRASSGTAAASSSRCRVEEA